MTSNPNQNHLIHVKKFSFNTGDNQNAESPQETLQTAHTPNTPNNNENVRAMIIRKLNSFPVEASKIEELKEE